MATATDIELYAFYLGIHITASLQEFVVVYYYSLNNELQELFCYYPFASRDRKRAGKKRHFIVAQIQTSSNNEHTCCCVAGRLITPVINVSAVAANPRRRPYLCSPGSMFPTKVRNRFKIRIGLGLGLGLGSGLGIWKGLGLKGKNTYFQY